MININDVFNPGPTSIIREMELEMRLRDEEMCNDPEFLKRWERAAKRLECLCQASWERADEITRKELTSHQN